MIRIYTKVGEFNSVLTVTHNNIWYTFSHRIGNATVTHEARSLMEAGQNHLRAALKLKKKASDG